MAGYPIEKYRLMDNYDLAQKYSWDTASLLKLVKIQMCMKYQEINSKILHVIHEHALENAKSAGFERKLDENIEAFIKQSANLRGRNVDYRVKSLGKIDDSVTKGAVRHKELDEVSKSDATVSDVSERYLEDIEEEEEIEVLDEMQDKYIDQLEIDMPNINRFFPKIEPDGSTKKVQFSVGKRVSENELQQGKSLYHLYAVGSSCYLHILAQFGINPL